MNADARRWNRGSLALALLGSLFTSPAISADFKSQLGDEIERRFEAAAIELDNSPMEFGCKFSTYIAYAARSCRTFQFVSKPLLVSRDGGWQHLEESASLPAPTMVETRITKGFPSGEVSGGNGRPLRDDSYHLAPDYRSYRGVTMLFGDERMLVAGQTFYR